MKILIATGIYPPEVGGPAKYAQALDAELKRRGFAPDVLIYSQHGRGLPIGLRHAWYFLLALTRMRRTTFVLALDTWSAGLPALIAARLMRKTVVVRIGGDFLWESYTQRTGQLVKLSAFYTSPRAFTRKERLIRRGTSFVLRHADVLLFNSAWQRDIWLAAYRFAPGKASVLENEFAGVHPSESNGKVFVAASRGIRYKNIPALERVFMRIAQKHPDVSLDMRVLPPAEHLARLRSAYAVVVPSVSEINPNTVWEGVSTGKPFICPVETGCRERLDGLGFFVDTADEAALEAALEQLLVESEYQQFASAIRAFSFRHDWSQIADEVLESAGVDPSGPRVLMLSGDAKALDSRSGVHERLLLQESQVARLDVFVPGEKLDVPLDHGGGVHGFSGSKVGSARAMQHAGRCLDRVDVVTAQDPFYLGLVAWRIARAQGASLNLQVHADLLAQPFGKRMLARFLLKRADSVRVVSEKLRQQVAHLTQAPVSVLPVFVDTLRFKGIVPLPHVRKTILWIGRFEKEKDPFAAIDIFHTVRSHVDAQLIMLGGGSLEEALRHRAEVGDATNAPISFPGWQNPMQYLDTADVVLCTSLQESWGASIVEALAAGVAVVAPDVGIAREAGAIVVERSDLAAAVIDVLQKGTRGSLRLELLPQEEWAKRWRESLLPVRVKA
ncbi:MAG TPA: glycosyltransferase [Gemmatimonadaceae bacterium]|jgi:glycosyltransferase involved in cell wall biosynthesis